MSASEIPQVQPEAREATQAKAREARAMTRDGWSPAAIAERMGVTVERVRQYLRMAYVVTPADPVSAAPAEDQPKPRLTERTVLHRAYTAMQRIRAFRLLSADNREFWLGAVLEIREAGDGVTLTFGPHGDLYESRASFASAFGRTEGDLDALCRPGLLVELESGIAMPLRFGLRPREKFSTKPTAREEDPRQLPLPPTGLPRPPGEGTQATDGNFGDGNFDGNFGQTFGLERGNISVNGSENFPNISEIAEIISFAPGATTTTVTKGINNLGDSGSESRATDQNFRPDQNLAEILPDGNFDGNFGDGNFADDQNLAVTAFGEELAALAGLPVPLQPRALGFIHRWHQDARLTHDLLRGIFRSVMARKNRPKVPDWAYFDKAVCDTLTAEKVPPAITPRSAAPPPTAEEKAATAARKKEQAALEHRTGPVLDWYVRHKTGPRPPLTAELQQHCGAGRKDPAFRWLAVYDAARAADDPSLCLNLPVFESYVASPGQYEDMMTEAEEAVTAPEDRPDG